MNWRFDTKLELSPFQMESLIRKYCKYIQEEFGIEYFIDDQKTISNGAFFDRLNQDEEFRKEVHIMQRFGGLVSIKRFVERELKKGGD